MAGEEKGIEIARGGEPRRRAEGKECRGREGAAAAAEQWLMKIQNRQ